VRVEICVGGDSAWTSRDKAEQLIGADKISRCRKCSGDFVPIFHPETQTMDEIRQELESIPDEIH
jgi:hypothetical protein